MLELSTLLDSSSLPLSRCPNFSPVSNHCDSTDSLYPKSVESKDLDEENDWCCSWNQRLRFPIVRKGGICAGKNGVGIKISGGSCEGLGGEEGGIGSS
ncbi:hypothetical protein BVC80_7917g5 [Macleaya cordata]|uniref:Uncharacterized protein n=1 Tax=Macleaya cordata TaxID=56857 RepID=A0A200PN04_MACCD|nr:hypothetical protein BVC80_7917g5 [Macleaya cordata]